MASAHAVLLKKGSTVCEEFVDSLGATDHALRCCNCSQALECQRSTPTKVIIALTPRCLASSLWAYGTSHARRKVDGSFAVASTETLPRAVHEEGGCLETTRREIRATKIAAQTHNFGGISSLTLFLGSADIGKHPINSYEMTVCLNHERSSPKCKNGGRRSAFHLDNQTSGGNERCFDCRRKRLDLSSVEGGSGCSRDGFGNLAHDEASL
mmetsp:Transcript_20227/g.60415  ORF Transcript_20227/g.60415 Transcript_20227/m.60415 type:complete len:211 (+) Transcript_20227:615-1247(+)